MENQLEIIADSYDKAIEGGRESNGINPYDNLPEYIINDPDYPKYKAEIDNGNNGGSENKKIKDFLLPNPNMKFIDLGCCLNLMFKGYNEWLSIYYGVDISQNTIQLLNEYVDKNKLNIGKLFCGSIHETPFENNFFDIGACIGILEYFERDYLEKAIVEIHRIMKPDGKLALDIPNILSPSCRIMFMIEKHLERPCKFNILPNEFENIIENYFEIIKKDDFNNGSMGLGYYLKCKK